METVDQAEARQWVVRQIAYLDPPEGWRPDAGVALQRFHARMTAEGPAGVWRRWPVWAAALMVAIALILLLPSGRGVAQQIWQLLTVRRVAFIQVNPWPAGVPSPQAGIIGTPIPPIPARDVEEVSRRVHYDLRLPRAGVLSSTPQLYSTFSVSAGMRVKAKDLELALRKSGITDASVPPQWDGAQLALHSSAVAIAQWPDVALAQSLPLTLTAPAGFDFPAFSALVLRVLGVSPVDAQRLAERSGTVTPWLAPILRDFEERATIEEITLRSGPATLMQDKAGVTVVWSVPDRVYVLRGTLSRELAIAVADAVE